MAWARLENIPIISTAEIHYNNEKYMYGYCLEGTEGQRKIHYTLLSDRVSFPADGWNALPADLLRSHRQIILHKRCIDPFDEPRIDRLLSEIWADEFIIIGAGTEYAVEATGLGLLQRGKNVSLVVDAIGSHNKREAMLALRKMEAKGINLVETKNLAGISHVRYINALNYRMCINRMKGVINQS